MPCPTDFTVMIPWEHVLKEFVNTLSIFLDDLIIMELVRDGNMEVLKEKIKKNGA